jgi:peptide chain release factor 2
MVTAEQIKALGERLERLQSYLNLEQKRIHIINEEEKTVLGRS